MSVGFNSNIGGINSFASIENDNTIGKFGDRTLEKTSENVIPGASDFINPPITTALSERTISIPQGNVSL